MKLARNSLYSLLAAALPTVLAIVAVPLFVRLIGAERHGALAIAWLLLGYFGAADFGIGRAITQRIASLRGEGAPPPRLATATWSAIVSTAGFGLVGAALTYLAAHWYFGTMLQAGDGLRGESLAAIGLLALCNPVVALSGVLGGALMGMERFRLVAASNLVSTSGLLLLPLGAAWAGHGALPALVLAALVARLIGLAMLAAGVWRLLLGAGRLAFQRDEFRHLTRFGAWIMLSALVGPLMVMVDRFVIGAIADAAAVAAYTIPFQIAARTQMLPAALVQALFPRLASLAPGDAAEQARDFLGFVGLAFAPVIAVLICLSQPLMGLWLGDALDPRSVLVAQIVLAGFWVNGLANVPYALIQARGDPRYTAMLHVAELPLYFLLLLGLGWQFGLGGIAAAFAVRCALDCALLIRRAGAAGAQMLLRLALPAMLVASALASANLLSDWRWLLIAALLTGALGVVALAVAMPDAIRARLLALLKRP